jgi:hypothetical protein
LLGVEGSPARYLLITIPPRQDHPPSATELPAGCAMRPLRAAQ